MRSNLKIGDVEFDKIQGLHLEPSRGLKKRGKGREEKRANGHDLDRAAKIEMPAVSEPSSFMAVRY